MNDATIPTGLDRPPEFTVGTVLGRTFSVWGSNLVTFLGASFIVHVPVLLLGREAQTNPFVSLASTVLQLFLGFVLTGTLTAAVFAQLRGQRSSLGEAFRAALNRLGAMLATGLLQTVIMVLLAFLLVFPAVMAACAYWVAIPAALVDRLGPTDALRRSADLTRGYRWSIFGMLVLLSLSNVVLIAVLVGAQVFSPALLPVVQFMVTSVLSSVYAVLTAVTYYQLRAVKEGLALEDLATVFD